MGPGNAATHPCLEAPEDAADGSRHPAEKPEGGELAESDQAFSAVIRGVHAALALLRLEHDRTVRTKITERHKALRGRVHRAGIRESAGLSRPIGAE